MEVSVSFLPRFVVYITEFDKPIRLPQLHREFVSEFGEEFDGLILSQTEKGAEIRVMFKIAINPDALDAYMDRVIPVITDHVAQVGLADMMDLWETNLKRKPHADWDIDDLRKAVLIIAQRVGLAGSLTGE